MEQKAVVVLSGGGAKGLYHIGAWQALRELNVPIAGVIGNSVGALIAGFMAQGAFYEACEALEDLDLGKIIKLPEGMNEKDPFEWNDDLIKQLKSLQQSVLAKKGLDTEPLYQMLTKYLDESHIRSRGIDLGIVTYQLNKMRPREIFIEDMEEGNLLHYLLASATLPGFKPTKIGEDIYIDGGVYNNIPLSMAKARGYRNIIVIDIAGIGVTRKMDYDNCRLTYIKNNSDIGGLLDFDQKSLVGLRELGYRDTLKVFGELDGINYYVRRDEMFFMALARLWEQKGEDFIPEDIWRDQDRNDKDRLLKRLRGALPEDMRSHANLLMVAAECAAQALNITNQHIYQWKEFLDLISERHKSIMEEVWETVNSFSESSASDWMKKSFSLMAEYQKNHKKDLYKYFLLGRDIKQAYPLLPVTQLENSNPMINPARIFLNLLEEYRQQD